MGSGEAARVITTPEAEPADLVVRCARGDQAALAHLYDMTAAHVNGLALRILGDRDTAEEITGDVFLQAWRSAASYDPSRGSPIAWLLTITRSRAIDRLRATATERRQTAPLDLGLKAPAPGPGPEEASSLVQRSRFVRAAMGRLSREQREAIELAFFADQSHNEIADVLGIPLGTIKTRIRLGMGRMRDVLRDQGGFAS
ncbi:MAG: sigma-70 family RNA polymerase sigma factor [Deltaproteobacteria bacterium]|nr:sigma-70 family RNA polymerase sigma factor [Deltaproteobacteria bacterium]